MMDESEMRAERKNVGLDKNPVRTIVNFIGSLQAT